MPEIEGDQSFTRLLDASSYNIPSAGSTSDYSRNVNKAIKWPLYFMLTGYYNGQYFIYKDDVEGHWQTSVKNYSLMVGNWDGVDPAYDWGTRGLGFAIRCLVSKG